MDWNQIVREIRTRVALKEVSEETGLSISSVHDLEKGNSHKVFYDVGVLLLKLHKRVMRRKAKR
jgi:8-oxo-dGTP pyrophosphatase MutT (NUDIX family)